ncbi:hypothetical protein JCM19237_2930 [Photobacterium aphoticum]|uniref:Uncharacterized protein n=1 Tax=Photobacterium aphoticum TaxID=754436 RepID=A0A090QUS1_9GAMM|nr:hypothetical protein JCM19237_2930 [Photobacterium aphoticum]
MFITGVGAFEFDCGRLLPPKRQSRKALNVLSEVNREIQHLALEWG